LRHPIAASVYCTTKCGAGCKHCGVSRSGLKGYDADPDAVDKFLWEFRKLRGRYADFTGGNPINVDWLPGRLDKANALGIYTSLTVSGPIIMRRLNEWGVDFMLKPRLMRFSIDGGRRFHNENRGMGYFEIMLYGLRIALKIRHKGTTQLIFTIMPGEEGNLNRDQFSEVLQLAHEENVLVIANPVFNVDERLKTEKGDAYWLDVTQRNIDDLIWFAKKANVQFSRGKLCFLLNGGNNYLNPTCCAARSVATFTANNELALPCYHHTETVLSLDKGLKAAYDSAEWKIAAEQSGRYSFCKGCIIWCYAMPSLLYRPYRLVTWEHALCGFQSIRDNILQMAERLHKR
jgi:MoaA/NifB/PqqE/SkfB family radical SAM enzyme